MAGSSLAIGYGLFFLVLIIGISSASDEYARTHDGKQRMDWLLAVGDLIYTALFGPRSHGAGLVWLIFIIIVNGLFYAALVFLTRIAFLLLRRR